jgi:hypothetical protein
MARTRAPFVDHPVVVNGDARHREFFVFALQKRLAAKSRKDIRETN